MSDTNDRVQDFEDDSDTIYIPKGEVSYKTTEMGIGTLLNMWNEGELRIPAFQRRFVWTIEQASKFVDSVMSGLPFQTVTFYKDKDEFLYIIDGQQRIKSLLYFTENFNKDSVDLLDKKYIGFKLKGLSKKSPYFEKTFNGVDGFSDVDKRALKNKAMPVTIITLKNPNDLTSVYYIFERLNKGGTPLKAQEIRSCICSGKFNDFLIRINKNEKWQSFITSEYDRIHQKDAELILRFFALYDCSSVYKRPMKDFLTEYFRKVKNSSQYEIEEKERLFLSVVDAIYDNIGSKPFHGTNGLNAAFADSIMVAFAHNLDNIPKNIKSRCYQLTHENRDFYSYASKSADDVKSVKNRIELAEEILFQETEEDAEKIIKLYNFPMSVSTPDWLSDEKLLYEEITVKNRRADFAIRINDDSMIPKINKGDIVLVKQEAKIKAGQMGIFTYKNHLYCKKYVKNKSVYLSSENPKQKTVRIEDMSRFFVNGIIVDILPKETETLM